MKKQYIAPELELSRLKNIDVIMISSGDVDGGFAIFPDSWTENASVDGAFASFIDSWIK